MSVVVLGMHRSGTSLLVGLLEKYGYSLGSVSKKTSPLKPTGTRENFELRTINNQILKFNNASWDQPNKILKTNDQIEQKMKLFSMTLHNKKWALKDPRMLLTYNLWKKVLPEHHIVATIRHPFQVAQSLEIKNQTRKTKALEIWFFYNQQLMKIWNQYKFPILNFDESPSDYFQSLKKLQNYLKINVKKEIFDFFYTERKTTIPNQVESLVDFKEIENLYISLLEISKRTLKHGYQ